VDPRTREAEDLIMAAFREAEAKFAKSAKTRCLALPSMKIPGSSDAVSRFRASCRSTSSVTRLGPKRATPGLHLVSGRRELALAWRDAPRAPAGRLHALPVCGLLTIRTHLRVLLCRKPRRRPPVRGGELAGLYLLSRRRLRGRYFVLGGLLSPLEGTGPEDIRVPALLEPAAQPPRARGEFWR
jgi:hypothetical protein